MDSGLSGGGARIGAEGDDGAAGREHAVGVGPWEGPWPEDPRLDPELLRDGDRRNVLDHYRYWRLEAIVEDLDRTRHGFHVAIENWQHDLNIGTVVRTANAFNAEAVHIIGRRRWNRRGAMVTDRYLHVMHHPDVEAFVAWAQSEGLPVLGVDLFPDSVPLETFDLPERCVLVFGQEGPGLSEEVRQAVEATLSIAQFGSTRSMNAASAAAIAMHAWVRRWAFGQRATPAP
ncbi:TrmH family RNA methyltransferase [Falsarthrobacter nasiphocae]|uniref:tRNA G18 (Ribose-2'-O)-methylase SpoU n=1 Tax=Falsarthrobacter nasiphocae TaxID=189863 RepID=A0AAE4C688_9MICC|nr:TrmH family RNA methyltransferase [Falsarthrobacter nasiphocae]MDR6891877.1 tRNA G18 (ribose-2'-O)-methylase SpoU [Falsarthrobacter nasiphocae]